MGRLDDWRWWKTAGVTKEPTRKFLAEWIVGAKKKISGEMGSNAWKKKGFEWVSNLMISIRIKVRGEHTSMLIILSFLVLFLVYLIM